MVCTYWYHLLLLLIPTLLAILAELRVLIDTYLVVVVIDGGRLLALAFRILFRVRYAAVLLHNLRLVLVLLLLILRVLTGLLTLNNSHVEVQAEQAE